MLFVDLHLFTGEKTSSAEELLEKYASNINYIFYLGEEIESVFIQHAGIDHEFTKNKVRFIIRKGKNKKIVTSFFFLFLEIRKMKPEVVLMHGLIQPILLLFAKLIFGRKTKIIIQNHAELPYKGWRRHLQKMAAKYSSAFLFVSKEQSKPWVEAGIIQNKNLVFEVMEGSTSFISKDKTAARRGLKFDGKILFLWVGRLDVNKDPLTILRAFNSFAAQKTDVKLWMVYNETVLLNEVKEFIRMNNLKEKVQLLGRIEHSKLEDYYNAADYFILGSHYEGSGYALCEAMACACVPIVTRIPSFEWMLYNEEIGYLFEPGNPDELLSVLYKLNEKDLQRYKLKVLRKFKDDLSFEAIAKRIQMTLYLISKK